MSRPVATAPSRPFRSILQHPCFTDRAHFRYGRLHLPVAPRCNISCAYCDRKVVDCPHTSRPGITARILAPKDVAALVETSLAAEPRLRVIGVAGPGEPLANPETFASLRVAREAWARVARRLDEPGRPFPEPVLCLSTNGLLLPDSLGLLLEAGVSTLTVTVNAISPGIAAAIYRGVPLAGGPAELVERQLRGIRQAASAGLVVKVNTVLIPGVNWSGDTAGEEGEKPGSEDETVRVARAVAATGACLQNIIPLIPLGAFRDRRAPTCEELRRAREAAGQHLRQFRLCRQCRADAVGVPAEEVR